MFNTYEVKNTEWIKRFEERYGRPPRILHIGNIANNAYQMAKMLNTAGCDCDVLCKDYYDVMACPEWDDADIIGEVENVLFPRWDLVNLNGFFRPKWFAQGPSKTCVQYLLARRKNKKTTAFLLWKKLQKQCKYISIEQKATLYVQENKGKRKNNLWDYVTIFAIQFIFRLKKVLHFIGSALKILFTRPYDFWVLCKKFWFCLVLRTKKMTDYDNVLVGDSVPVKNAKERAPDKTQIRMHEIQMDFSERFPDRIPFFGELTKMLIHYVDQYEELYNYYDIVMTHDADPIPYLAKFKNVVASEYGAIRDLPYEKNQMATLMLLSYSDCKAIYNTNIDSYDSAEYLIRNTSSMHICGLHGIDIDRIDEKQRQSLLTEQFDGRFGTPKDVPIFFFGGRHDYDIKRCGFIKGDELLIPALAKLHRENYKFKIIMITFGRDIDKTKDLINAYEGLSKHIIWTPIMDKRRLYKCIQDVDGIIDQFCLKAFGGVAIEALISGKAPLIGPIMDKNVLSKYFPEVYPAYGCDSVESIYYSMKDIIENPEKCREMAQKSREWVFKYHSNEAIVERCCESFQACIPLLDREIGVDRP